MFDRFLVECVSVSELKGIYITEKVIQTKYLTKKHASLLNNILTKFCHVKAHVKESKSYHFISITKKNENGTCLLGSGTAFKAEMKENNINCQITYFIWYLSNNKFNTKSSTSPIPAIINTISNSSRAFAYGVIWFLCCLSPPRSGFSRYLHLQKWFKLGMTEQL